MSVLQVIRKVGQMGKLFVVTPADDTLGAMQAGVLY